MEGYTNSVSGAIPRAIRSSQVRCASKACTEEIRTKARTFALESGDGKVHYKMYALAASQLTAQAVSAILP